MLQLMWTECIISEHKHYIRLYNIHIQLNYEEIWLYNVLMCVVNRAYPPMCVADDEHVILCSFFQDFPYNSVLPVANEWPNYIQITSCSSSEFPGNLCRIVPQGVCNNVEIFRSFWSCLCKCERKKKFSCVFFIQQFATGYIITHTHIILHVIIQRKYFFNMF